LQAKGVEWVKTDPSDLGAVLDELGRRGINELHVEAGATLTGALLSGGLVDEVLLYLAPTFLGPGRPLAELPELTQLSTPPSAWQFIETKAVGPDLRIRLRRR
jgi:diaminohydroxyphosphoribosylaminopyrimidine deaminase/5-amino-6-(5-phosphoribosylamino)uracil reductase